MLHRHTYDALIGNWEEPGVIGTRIEISRTRVLILWRNTTVLDTAYSVKEDNDTGTLHLKLRETGMRYPQSSSDYAAVLSLDYADGVLRFRERFPISGDSETLLRQTENSRYGNYTVADDEIIPQLQGSWSNEQDLYPIRIRGNRIMMNGETTQFHVLQSRSGYPAGYKIADADPAQYGLFFFSEVFFDGGELSVTVPVCDAPSVTYRYRKV